MSEPIGNNTITDAELEAELAELLETQEEEKLNDMGLPDLSQLNLKGKNKSFGRFLCEPFL